MTPERNGVSDASERSVVIVGHPHDHTAVVAGVPGLWGWWRVDDLDRAAVVPERQHGDPESIEADLGGGRPPGHLADLLDDPFGVCWLTMDGIAGRELVERVI